MSLALTAKGFLQSGRNMSKSTGTLPPRVHTSGHGNYFTCSQATSPHRQEGTDAEPPRSWPQGSLSLGLRQVTGPPTDPGLPSAQAPVAARAHNSPHGGLCLQVLEDKGLILRGERKHGGGGRCRGLTFESLLVARLYKVFLFKSKWLQTSLAASGP